LAITGQPRRRRIVINADAYISGATSNVPVLVKFNSTSHPDLFATGDDKDSVWFSSDAGGQTTLYHEGVVFDATDAIFYVKVDLSSTADTVIYFWYGLPAITGTESKTNVWTNGISILHFNDNLNDSSVSNDTGAGTNISYSTTSAIGKKSASFNGSSAYISSYTSFGTTDSYTLMALLRPTSSDKSFNVRGRVQIGSNHWGWRHSDGGYSRCYGNASVFDVSNNSAKWTNNEWNLISWVYDHSSKDNCWLYKNTSRYGYVANDVGTVSYNATYDAGAQIGRWDYKTGVVDYYAGLADNFFLFSAVKSADFITAVYNNVANYSTFITIDGAVTIGSSPKQVYPAWLETQQLTEDIDISSTSTIGVTTKVEYKSNISLTSVSDPSTSIPFGCYINSGIQTTSEILFTANWLLTASVSSTSGASVGTLSVLQSNINLSGVSAITLTTSHAQSYSVALGSTSEIVPAYTSQFILAIPLFTTSGVALTALLVTDIEVISLNSVSSVTVVGIASAEREWLTIYSTSSVSTSIISTGRTVLFWSIEVDGIILEDNYDLEYAKFTDEKGKRSDYFEIVLNNNDGSISDIFNVGNDVYLYVDEDDPATTKVFHGLITSIDFEIDSWGHNKLILSGEDYGSVRFGQTIISGAENYSNTTASDILADIILRYCPEITTTNVETFVDQIPFVSFAWEYVSQAIDKIARLVGADYYVDEDDDLHFYDPADLTASHSITASQILNAKIKKDSSKYFDRVFVVGGKQGFLDQSQATTTTEVSLYDKYYASSFTPSQSSLLYIEAYVKKVGSPLDGFRFTIVEDNTGPTGNIVGFGTVKVGDTSTDGSWVKSDYIDVQLDKTKLHWIVFQKYGTATDTYKVAHDNTTASGHRHSTDGSSWTAATGKCAFKTYYGVQIVKGASGTKMFDNYTDIPIIDFSIKDTDTALMLAQQKVIEYALKNASKLEINPPGKRMKAGEVISVSIPNVTLEDQTILSVAYEINDPHIARVKLECTAAEDFYSTFANLFSELRKLKVKNVLQRQETSTDYKETTETVTITSSVTITEVALDYEVVYDDAKSIWGVSKWE